MSKEVVKPEVSQAEIAEAAVETAWGFPFSKAHVDGWKARYGKDNVHLVEDSKGNPYVIRGLFRKEFLDKQQSKFRNEEDLEDQFVLEALLYPELSHIELRNKFAALSNQLFERLVEVSNVDASRDKEPEVLTEDSLPEEISNQDFVAWKNFNRGADLYIVKFEGRNFVYKGLRRSEYEKFRDAQRQDNKGQNHSENEVCSLGIVFPLPKDFDPTSNDYLYGTISSLAVMIMKVSGFGAATKITKL